MSAVRAHESHLPLLERARALELGAIRRDTNAIHHQLCQLRTELGQHLEAERDAVDHLSPIARGVVARRQTQLRRLVDELLAVSEGDGRECNCVVRSSEVARELVRQARLEAGLLEGRA